jgi:hypothetical protein
MSITDVLALAGQVRASTAFASSATRSANSSADFGAALRLAQLAQGATQTAGTDVMASVQSYLTALSTLRVTDSPTIVPAALRPASMRSTIAAGATPAGLDSGTNASPVAQSSCGCGSH